MDRSKKVETLSFSSTSTQSNTLNSQIVPRMEHEALKNSRGLGTKMILKNPGYVRPCTPRGRHWKVYNEDDVYFSIDTFSKALHSGAKLAPSGWGGGGWNGTLPCRYVKCPHKSEWQKCLPFRVN